MMSFRNASLFALISVSLVLAVTTFSLWYTLMMFGGAMGFAFPLSLWIELGVQFATPLVVLFVMVSSLRKRTLDLNRVLATIFMVVTAGVLIHFGYKQIEGASRIREFSDLPGLVLQLVGYAGLFGCALCLFLRPVRKNATSWFLIIGSMANVIMIIPRFYNPGSFAYFGLDFWMAVLTIGSYFLALLLPLSLLVYGFSIERLGEDVKEDGLSHDELLDSKLNEQDAGISPTECVSIRRWTMHTFFGNIPLAGVIFSGLWSRGKQAGPVRNWAGAQLLLSAAVLLLWLYLKFKGSSNFMTIFGVACLVIVILGAAAIQNVLKNKAGANDEVSDEPGVFDWLGRLLIACIPVIGWIYLAIWVNDKEEMNRRNWAAAQLIVTGLATLYGLAFWL